MIHLIYIERLLITSKVDKSASLEFWPTEPSRTDLLVQQMASTYVEDSCASRSPSETGK